MKQLIIICDVAEDCKITEDKYNDFCDQFMEFLGNSVDYMGIEVKSFQVNVKTDKGA